MYDLVDYVLETVEETCNKASGGDKIKIFEICY